MNNLGDIASLRPKKTDILRDPMVNRYHKLLVVGLEPRDPIGWHSTCLPVATTATTNDKRDHKCSGSMIFSNMYRSVPPLLHQDVCCTHRIGTEIEVTYNRLLKTRRSLAIGGVPRNLFELTVDLSNLRHSSEIIERYYLKISRVASENRTADPYLGPGKV